MAGVRTIEEIRHARLLQLIGSAEFPTIQSLADRIEKSHAQVSQWKNKSERRNKVGEVTGVSNIDSASARWIEAKVGKPTGWMDNDPQFDGRTVVVQPARGTGEPKRPDFEAKDVSESEWSLLEDLRVMPEEEFQELRERAAKNRRNVDRVIAQRQAAAMGKAVADDNEKTRGQK